MAKLTVVEDNGHFNGHRISSEFSKKDGIKYCNNCGKECLIDDECCGSCKKKIFLSENDSGIIGGYIELEKRDAVKKYYDKYFHPKGSVKMNGKRIIHSLLQHKEKIGIKKEMVDKIYNANILAIKR